MPWPQSFSPPRTCKCVHPATVEEGNSFSPLPTAHVMVPGWINSSPPVTRARFMLVKKPGPRAPCGDSNPYLVPSLDSNPYLVY